MNLSQKGINLLKSIETLSLTPYDDARPKAGPIKDWCEGATIGYGHLVLRGENFSSGITEEQADAMLVRDSTKAINDASSIYASYKMKTPYMAQLVLVEMVFQMGKGGVQQFTGMLGAMAQGNYRLAAAHIRNSAWYGQTTRRAEFMARRLEACQ